MIDISTATKSNSISSKKTRYILVGAEDFSCCIDKLVESGNTVVWNVAAM